MRKSLLSCRFCWNGYKKAPKKKRQVVITTHSQSLLSNAGISGKSLLILTPSPEGTTLSAPNDAEMNAMASGFSPAEVVLPRARKVSSSQPASIKTNGAYPLTHLYLGVEDRLSEAVGNALISHVFGDAASFTLMMKEGAGYLQVSRLQLLSIGKARLGFSHHRFGPPRLRADAAWQVARGYS